MAGRFGPLKAFGRFGSIGIEMGLSVGLGYLIGHWLDGRFQSAPWLTLVFVLFGVVAGFRSLWRLARRAQREVGGGPPKDEGPGGSRASGSGGA